jgi:hypothetical protein
VGGEENIFGESNDQFKREGKILRVEWLALWMGVGYCEMLERRFTISMG